MDGVWVVLALLFNGACGITPARRRRWSFHRLRHREIVERGQRVRVRVVVLVFRRAAGNISTRCCSGASSAR